MSDPVQMTPEWPKVRCDRCRKTYTQNFILKPNCPNCGHDRFSTSMSGYAQAIVLTPALTDAEDA